MTIMKDFFFITAYGEMDLNFLSAAFNQLPQVHCQYGIDQSFETLDDGMKQASENPANIIGNIASFSAYELYQRLLSERTKTFFRRANLVCHPAVRIQMIVDHCRSQYKDHHDFWEAHKNFLKEPQFAKIKSALVHKEEIDLSHAENLYFIYALAQIIKHDPLDFMTPGVHVQIERLVVDEEYFVWFFEYLTRKEIALTKDYLDKIKNHFLSKQAKQFQVSAESMMEKWASWQRELLSTLLMQQYTTLFFPYLTKPLIAHYQSHDYFLEKSVREDASRAHEKQSPLVSIHLNSNRPMQLVDLFDNLEETTTSPSCMEVLINVDDDDVTMMEMLEKEKTRRAFTIKYITSPKPNSFCDLWKPLNKLLPLTHPQAYFLLNISDEMLFKTKNWDLILQRYVGLFPDHLFRLRASRNKFRNYFDVWECGFAQDCITFTTKRWLDINGDWNPCFGPDSFQQLVMFYLWMNGKFANQQYQRDIPLVEIEFLGDTPALGVPDDVKASRFIEHTKAWFTTFSHQYLTEAKRRACLINAYIFAAEAKLTQFEVKDNSRRKQILLLDASSRTVKKFHYRVSWIFNILKNTYRKIFFNYYIAGAGRVRKNPVYGLAFYFFARYIWFRKIVRVIKKCLRYLLSDLLPLQSLRGGSVRDSG